MDRLQLTHEARCLLIVTGGALERHIENRAREIADARAAAEIAREDVMKATAEFLAEGLSNLPHLIERAIDNYQRQLSKAA